MQTTNILFEMEIESVMSLGSQQLNDSFSPDGWSYVNGTLHLYTSNYHIMIEETNEEEE
jgi:hypothetical protein